MTDEQIEAMLSDIIQEIDYDIWKEAYNEESAEEDPQEVPDNYAVLISIVRRHMEDA